MRQSATRVLFAWSIPVSDTRSTLRVSRSPPGRQGFEQRPSKTTAFVDTAPRAKREEERANQDFRCSSNSRVRQLTIAPKDIAGNPLTTDDGPCGPFVLNYKS